MPKKGTEEPVTGVFTGHAKGFGFVTVEGMDEDIYIGEEDVHGALHQDTVQVRLKSLRDGKRREGTIIKILSRGRSGLWESMRRVKITGSWSRTTEGIREIFSCRKNILREP